MSDNGEIDFVQRPETGREAALREWMVKQELASVDNLEAAARQIIQLVTAFYSVIFGVLALSDAAPASALLAPLAVALGAGSTLALLVALIAALIVVMPRKGSAPAARPDEERRLFNELLARKSTSLDLAIWAFGVGLVLFAALILALLWAR